MLFDPTSCFLCPLCGHPPMTDTYIVFPSGCVCVLLCMHIARGTCGISLSPQLPVHFTRQYTKLEWAHFAPRTRTTARTLNMILCTGRRCFCVFLCVCVSYNMLALHTLCIRKHIHSSVFAFPFAFFCCIHCHAPSMQCSLE